MFRTLKEPKKILEELDDLVPTNRFQERIYNRAREFFTKLDNQIPKLKQLVEAIRKGNGTPPKDLKGGSTYADKTGALKKSGGSGKYKEYDVNPAGKGGRDGERIIIDQETGRVWYSPNHYKDFYDITDLLL